MEYALWDGCPDPVILDDDCRASKANHNGVRNVLALTVGKSKPSDESVPRTKEHPLATEQTRPTLGGASGNNLNAFSPTSHN